MGDLLLYSLVEFSELIFDVLRAIDARVVIEVGSEAGKLSGGLRSFADRNDLSVFSIDPSPTTAVREEAMKSSRFQLLEKRSLEVLPTLPAADAYIIDGDHNYHTVFNELAAIDERLAGKPSVIFEHDVSWPSARRDQYYAPMTLPPSALLAHTFGGGVTLDDSGIVPGGMRGEGAFAYALQEGGPRNGVLTAIEDFLATHPGYEFVRIPAIFGLGVLFTAVAPWAAEVRRILEPLHESRLLARLERNRLELYLRVLQLQDEVVALREGRPSVKER